MTDWLTEFSVNTMKSLARMGTRNPKHCNETLDLPSRDTGRTIRANIYRPSTIQEPTPVLLNLHGSGFIIPAHGSDDDFCSFIANNANYTVLDIQYRLAPEDPFPAAFHDIEDIIHYVLSCSNTFDSKIALSGFSAGGNLALSICSSSTFVAREAISSIIVFYAPTNLAEDPGEKRAPEPSSKKIPAALSRYFHKCYIPSGVDPRDPMISPLFADPEVFPGRVLVITAAQDAFANEGEVLARRIGGLPNRHVVIKRAEGCPHGWDKFAVEGTVFGDARDMAYKLAVDTLLGNC